MPSFKHSSDDLLQVFEESGRCVEPTARAKGLEHALHGESILDMVRAAIDRLPDAYRTIVMLRDMAVALQRSRRLFWACRATLSRLDCTAPGSR